MLARKKNEKENNDKKCTAQGYLPLCRSDLKGNKKWLRINFKMQIDMVSRAILNHYQTWGPCSEKASWQLFHINSRASGTQLSWLYLHLLSPLIISIWYLSLWKSAPENHFKGRRACFGWLFQRHLTMVSCLHCFYCSAAEQHGGDCMVEPDYLLRHG